MALFNKPTGLFECSRQTPYGCNSSGWPTGFQVRCLTAANPLRRNSSGCPSGVNPPAVPWGFQINPRVYSIAADKLPMDVNAAAVLTGFQVPNLIAANPLGVVPEPTGASRHLS